MLYNELCDLNIDFKILSELPLVHTTNIDILLDSILNDKKIKPQHCKIFNKELTYLFYGRPDYKVSFDPNSQFYIDRLPACLILNTAKIGRINAIYPFDTGGFDERYQDYFTKYKVNEFYSGDSILDIKKMISLFYGTNYAYIFGKPKNIINTNGSLILMALHKFLSAPNSSKFDERHNAIEIQIDTSLDITDIIEAIIIPSDFSNNKLINWLDNNGVRIITYFSFETSCPDGYNTVLKQKAMEYLQERGYENFAQSI